MNNILQLNQLSSERLNLYSEHIQNCLSDNRDLFTEEFFDEEFVPLVERQLPTIEKIFREQLVGMDSIPLVTANEVKVKIDTYGDDDLLFEATPEENNAVTIYVGKRVFFYIDLLNDSDAELFEHDDRLDSAVFDEILESLEYTLGLTMLSGLALLTRFVQKSKLADKDEKFATGNIGENFTEFHERRRWCRNSGFAIFWLLSHEYSHFIMGHTSFYSEQKEQKVADDVFDHYMENHFKQAEFAADIYATFRLIQGLISNLSAKHMTIIDDIFLDNLSEAIFSAIGPALQLIAISSKPTISETNTYPYPLSRVLGVFSAVDYFMKPNTPYFGNMPNDPLGAFRNALNFDNDPIKYVFLLFCYMKHLKLMIRRLSNVFITSIIEREVETLYEFLFYFMRLTFAARNAMSDMGLLKALVSEWGSLESTPILSWFSNMDAYCNSNVGFFVPYMKKDYFMTTRNFPKKVISLEQEKVSNANEMPAQVVDPAYKMLDDWMTHIQARSFKVEKKVTKSFWDFFKQVKFLKFFNKENRADAQKEHEERIRQMVTEIKANDELLKICLKRYFPAICEYEP